jgi:hypothetical protein
MRHSAVSTGNGPSESLASSTPLRSLLRPALLLLDERGSFANSNRGLPVQAVRAIAGIDLRAGVEMVSERWNDDYRL